MCSNSAAPRFHDTKRRNGYSMIGLEVLLKVIWVNPHISQRRKLKPRELKLVAGLGPDPKLDGPLSSVLFVTTNSYPFNRTDHLLCPRNTEMNKPWF